MCMQQPFLAIGPLGTPEMIIIAVLIFTLSIPVMILVGLAVFLNRRDKNQIKPDPGIPSTEQSSAPHQQKGDTPMPSANAVGPPPLPGSIERPLSPNADGDVRITL